MTAVTRSAAWIKDAPIGMEYCDLTIEGSRLSATAVAIGSQPVPYRLDYELETHDNWVTDRLVARTRGEGWARSLTLERSGDGVWTGSRDGQGKLPGAESGVDPAMLGAEVLDIDVQYSPLTNLMPVRRLGLENVGTVQEFTMAWIAVPHLAIHEDGQRYIIVKRARNQNLVRYESVDGEFVAMLTCDDDALAIDYPAIARRLATQT